MELTYIIIAVMILLLPAFLSRVLSGGTGDTSKVLGAEPRSMPAGIIVKPAVQVPGKAPGAQPRPAGIRGTIRHAQGMGEKVKRLVQSGRKVEAIKLLHEQTGMSLKQAKDLVDRLG